MDHQPLDAAGEHWDQIEGDAASYLEGEREREEGENKRERQGGAEKRDIGIQLHTHIIWGTLMFHQYSCIHLFYYPHAHAQKINFRPHKISALTIYNYHDVKQLN